MALPRRIIALCGTQAWCHTTACALIGDHPHNDILWSGATIPAALATPALARAQQILGDEYGIAVIDAWEGFDPERLGAVSGTVRGGGALLLLLPPLDEWVARADPAAQRIAGWPHTPASLANRFIARTIRVLQSHPTVEWLSMGAPAMPLAIAAAPPHDASFRSADQQQALAAILHVVHGHRHRPLVLMADRGRGKSTSLGLAAAQLLKQGVKQIIVTAPHRNAVTTLLAQVSAVGVEQIRFIPPDELLRHRYPCELLLVDEAAAIPAPMLEQLLQRHARIVFATTVHGYEGSGRGFALRFFQRLDALTPGWKLLEMSEPIRWGVADPLERLTYDLLLLDAAPAAAAELDTATPVQLVYETIDGAQLADDEALLNELFGLLVLAHYRTTPLDLRQLLDSPNLAIHLARHHCHIAGAALTVREGGFDASLAAQIYSGERRPRGHLAPQSLAFHCGLPDAPRLSTERIMRIAIHPAVQRRGIGRALLAHVEARARHDQVDYLSTSFGATAELLHFWQHSTFLPVRIGLTREASSGHHSALLLRPLSPAAMTLFMRARRRFLGYLPLMLSDPLCDFAPDIAAQLLSGELPEFSPLLDEDDWRDLHAFATTHRGYESCLGAIHTLTHQALTNPLLMAELTRDERRLLIAKVIQRQPWSEVQLYCQTSGKHETVNVLRRAIGKLVGRGTP